MQTVDRAHYILWTQGTLLLNQEGHAVVVNEKQCIAADEALERGETVYLTIDGVIVSEMNIIGEAIVEALI